MISSALPAATASGLIIASVFSSDKVPSIFICLLGTWVAARPVCLVYGSESSGSPGHMPGCSKSGNKARRMAQSRPMTMAVQDITVLWFTYSCAARMASDHRLMHFYSSVSKELRLHLLFDWCVTRVDSHLSVAHGN